MFTTGVLCTFCGAQVYLMLLNDFTMTILRKTYLHLPQNSLQISFTGVAGSKIDVIGLP